MDHVIIVGGGLTAASAVETLRDEGFTGGIILLCEEAHLPYERPPLSKGYLLDSEQLDATRVHDAGWFEDRGVEVRVGAPASHLDVEKRTVYADGVDFSYDSLLIATGASPRRLPIEGIEHGMNLRTLEDAVRLKTELVSGRHVAIIGGGWIGLEVAAAARQRGCEVTVVEMGDLPLVGVLGNRLAEYIRDLHESHGVTLKLGTSVESVRVEDGKVLGLTTSAGPVDADVVVAATGVEPRVDLAQEAGVEVGNGIEVDERFRTSAPHVFAAGDVANTWHEVFEGRLRVEHWDNAMRQGKAAARSMLGQDARFDWQPYFFTDQFDFSMEFVGHPGPSDTVEIRGDMSQHQFIAYWLDGDRVTAGMNVNIWDVNDKLREMIGSRVSVEDLTDLT